MLRGGRKLTKLGLCFLPSFLATWVAVTRSVDNWHHYSDILVRSFDDKFKDGVTYRFIMLT